MSHNITAAIMVVLFEYYCATLLFFFIIQIRAYYNNFHNSLYIMLFTIGTLFNSCVRAVQWVYYEEPVRPTYGIGQVWVAPDHRRAVVDCDLVLTLGWNEYYGKNTNHLPPTGSVCVAPGAPYTLLSSACYNNNIL